VPINRLPPEIFALVVTFFKGRQLIKMTAVCKYWRTTLLSFPLLWNKIRCSGIEQFEEYLERSKFAPLEVQLGRPDPDRLRLLLPQISRLASLDVWVGGPYAFRWISHYLRNPMPTFHKFSITTYFGLDTLAYPSGVVNDHLLHVKKLCLNGMTRFRAPGVFPHVTELKWCVGSGAPVQVTGLLATMEQLPALEQVEILFEVGHGYTTTSPVPSVVTLPHVQQVALRCSDDSGIPHVLQFLNLPSLTSLVVDMVPILPWSLPTLPVTSFNKHLPNFAELQAMRVYMCREYGRVSFRSRSQASFEYYARARPLGKTPYHHDRELWGSLPLHSVRRLVVTMDRWEKGVEDEWLLGLFRDLRSLENLELEGYCGHTMRNLRQMMTQRDLAPTIKTLTVNSETDDVRQALKLKNVADGLGLGIVVTCCERKYRLGGLIIS